MEVVLKRIKRENYDPLIEMIIDEYRRTGNVTVDSEQVEKASEPILNGSDQIVISFDIEKYIQIANDNIRGYDKLAKIGMLLHRDISSTENKVPHNVCYEKEMWAYLSLTSFLPVVLKLRMDNESKINEDKIKRFIFNSGSIDRTGLLFLWVMVDRLESEDNPNLTQTAFEFIDPVKAIFERTSLSKNKCVLQAFVQGIINNGKDGKFKNNYYRLKVPNNISCFAAVNLLDAYGYEELVKVITQQQKEILSIRK